jgi:hypothetical protein
MVHHNLPGVPDNLPADFDRPTTTNPLDAHQCRCRSSGCPSCSGDSAHGGPPCHPASAGAVAPADRSDRPEASPARTSEFTPGPGSKSLRTPYLSNRRHQGSRRGFAPGSPLKGSVDSRLKVVCASEPIFDTNRPESVRLSRSVELGPRRTRIPLESRERTHFVSGISLRRTNPISSEIFDKSDLTSSCHANAGERSGASEPIFRPGATRPDFTDRANQSENAVRLNLGNRDRKDSLDQQHNKLYKKFIATWTTV